MRSLLVAAALALGAASAAAAPHVTRQVTATSDVRDAAVLGDAVLLATSGGLVVWRGGGVARTLTSLDGLPGTRLRSVSVVGGAVWVGGVDGAARLVPGAGGELAVAETIDLRRVCRVVSWRGWLWLATAADGLYRRPAKKGGAPERVETGRYRHRLTDLLPRGDRLWVATAGAGIVVVTARGVVARLIDHRHGLASDIVWDLADAGGGTSLIATSNGINRARGETIERRAAVARASRRLPVRDVRAVASRGDAVFAATYGAGVWRLEGAHRRRVSNTGPRTRTLLMAPGGLVVGHEGGADRVARGRARAMLRGGLPSADVTCLARAFGRLYIGTFSGGLASMDSAGRVRAERRAAGRWGLDRRINDLAVTREPGGGERLWIATDRGLWWTDGRTVAPASGEGAPGRVHITSLDVDAAGSLWATSARSVARRRGGRWRAFGGDARQPMIQAHAVTTDRKGRVWIGTLAGLLELDPESGALAHHDVASGALPVDWVTALEPWGDGIVAGTYHGGLSWLSGDRFRVERPQRERRGGLPAGWVNPHAMRASGGALWVGTLDRGLLVGHRGAWTRLRIDDGLPSDDVTAVLPAAGDMWVATRGGLARVSTAPKGAMR